MTDAINRFFQLLDWKTHRIQDSTLIVGGSAAVAGQNMAPVLPSGDWLATHGIGVLTYVEIIQVIGAFAVVVTTINIIARAFTSRKQ